MSIFKIFLIFVCCYCPFIANADVGLGMAGSGYSAGYTSPKFETDNDITKYIENQTWLVDEDVDVAITEDGDIYKWSKS